MSLEDRVSQVMEKISLATQKSGRSEKDVQLVAVSKRQSYSIIRKSFHLGIHDFGENYVQEYQDKKESLQDLKINWHFIGSIQSKKIKDIVGNFIMIHSVDRTKIMHEMDKQSFHKNCIQKILLQVNFSREESKSGFSEKEIPYVLEKTQSYKGLQVCGLMLMPNSVNDGELNRPVFSRARNCARIWAKYLSDGHHLNELSMGTSQDFETAIEEGATIIRIGTHLLGPRP